MRNRRGNNGEHASGCCSLVVLTVDLGSLNTRECLCVLRESRNRWRQRESERERLQIINEKTNEERKKWKHFWPPATETQPPPLPPPLQKMIIYSKNPEIYIFLMRHSRLFILLDNFSFLNFPEFFSSTHFNRWNFIHRIRRDSITTIHPVSNGTTTKLLFV